MKKLCVFTLLILLFGEIKAQWNPDTMVRNPICIVPYEQTYPVICRDGSRGYYIGWRHDNGTGNPKPRVQRVDSAGFIRWAANGIQVPGSFQTNNWLEAVVSDDSGGVIVGWESQVSLSEEIRVQRMDENGASLWGTNSVVVYGNIPNQSSYGGLYISDMRGGVLTTWNWGNGSIFGQRIDKNGNKAWGASPVLISAGYENAALISDGSGGLFSTYVVSSNLHAQHVDSSGNLLWGSGVNLNREPITSTGDESGPMCLDGNGGIYIAYDTIIGANWDVYCFHLDSLGSIISPPSGFAIASGSNSEYHFDIIPDNQGGIFAAYSTCLDPACNQETIIIKRINASGVQVWVDTACSNFTFDKKRVKLVSDGMGGLICSWFDLRPLNKPTIYSQRYDMNGNQLWFNWGYPVSAAGNLTQTSLVWHNLVPAESGAAIVTWTDTRTAAINGENIYMARIDGQLPVGIAGSPEHITAEVFPNPSYGNFTIQFPGIRKGTIEIFTVLGKKVLAESISNEAKKEINLTDFSQGIYYIRITDGENSTCRKLVKQDWMD